MWYSIVTSKPASSSIVARFAKEPGTSALPSSVRSFRDAYCGMVIVSSVQSARRACPEFPPRSPACQGPGSTYRFLTCDTIGGLEGGRPPDLRGLVAGWPDVRTTAIEMPGVFVWLITV